MIFTRDDLTHGVGASALLAGAIGLIVMAGCASAPPTVPPQRLDFPAPDSGPGRPEISRPEREQIDQGWHALQRGDAPSARVIASQAGASPAAELLRLQAVLVSGSGDPLRELEQLTAGAPDYAAAWITLSVAAEESDDEAVALTSAARGARLWPEKRWIEHESRLRQKYVGNRLDAAQDFYDADDPEAALEALAPALALDPENRDGVILKARALIATDRPDRAEAALSALPRDPEVVRLSGSIAEARGDLSAAMRIYSSLPDDPDSVLLAIGIAEEQEDWLTAMNLWESLPDKLPEKGPGLRRAKLQWRVSVMPTYVQEAIDSPGLDRGELAVLMVSLAPKVETIPGGQVPLLSDVMTLPSQNEILTATRLGLISSDQFLHRFHPERVVAAADVRTAVDRLANLLELEHPRWCGDGDEDQECARITEPVTGNAVASIVIEMVTREGDRE